MGWLLCSSSSSSNSSSIYVTVTTKQTFIHKISNKWTSKQLKAVETGNPPTLKDISPPPPPALKRFSGDLRLSPHSVC